MRVLLFLVILGIPGSCVKNAPAQSDSETFLPAKRLKQLTSKKMDEVSGIAASANNKGLMWAQNDSGNRPEIFLVDEKLSIRLTCKLEGAKNRDWEDIAVGPGPEAGKNYVYVADIGDNNSNHSLKYIYRFPEPIAGEEAQEVTIHEFDTIIFQLEDGKKDSEAIVVDPKTKDLYVISKREKPVYLYQLKFPYAPGDTLTAKKITSLPFTQIVSAAISSDGREVLLKNYDNVYYWKTKGKPLGEVLTQKPQILEYTPEPQGEAITFKRDGTGFYTLSEKILAEKVYLYFYERQKK
jgi:hypothetical protein